MISVAAVKRWLATLEEDDKVFIDDGGLSLMSVSEPDAYLEVGGESDFEDEDDED